MHIFKGRVESPNITRHRGPRVRSAGPLRVFCLLAFIGILSAACSNTPAPSASEKVCNDRSQLNNAVSTVVDDVKAGNFGKAKDDLPAVRDAVDSLSQSAKELTSDESEALSPQIDNLKKTAANLKDPASIADLQSGFSSLKSQIQSISTQIGETLKCS